MFVLCQIVKSLILCTSRDVISCSLPVAAICMNIKTKVFPIILQSVSLRGAYFCWYTN